MKRAVWISGVAAAVLLIAGGAVWYLTRGDKPAAPATQTLRIHGTVTLGLGQFQWSETTSQCTGFKGFDDIKPGAQVVVSDASSKTIALGSLAAGVPQKDPSDEHRALSCTLAFNVDAPAGQPFYGIEVSHRGRLQFAQDRITQPIELTF